MSRSGTPLNPTELIEKLEAACEVIDDNPMSLYSTFNDLVDYVRSHQAEEELAELAKDLTDPHLKAGDVILDNGLPVTVRGVNFYAPHKHPDSGLPPHRPVTEIVTSRGSRYITLVPQG
ncbi:hypothetical protein ACIBUR_39265 [Streptomyces anulatus]